MSLISLLAIYSLIKQAPNGGKTTDSASGNDQSSKDSSKPPVSSHFSGAGAVGGGSATGGSGGADGGGHNNPPPTGQGDAPLTAWTEEEMAALMQAVLNGNLQVISELLRQGKWDAGHFLAFIRLMRDHGVHLLEATNLDGHTVLHLAALYGYTEVVQEILGSGVPAQPTDFAITPLHCGVCSGSREMVSLLLQAGADPNAVDLDGNTPLHWAVSNGHTDIVQLLLQYHANPVAINYSGMMPIQFTQFISFPGALIQLLCQYQTGPCAAVPATQQPEDIAQLEQALCRVQLDQNQPVSDDSDDNISVDSP